MKYSVIIPTFNHCDDLLKPCVESILAHTHMDQVELVICANGCTDNTPYYLKRLQHQFESLGFGDHFRVITNDIALGFAKACNQGIQNSTGDRVVLLNNDCVLLPQNKQDWLNVLSAPFDQQPNVGITCTLLMHSTATNRLFAPFFCVMMDRSVIHKVGMLSEDFEVGGAEDMEYCWRAEQAGFQIVNVDVTTYAPEADIHVGQFPLYHKGEGTMHDASLVHDWPQTLQHNMHKLAARMNSPTIMPMCEDHTQVAARFSWLRTVSAESPELFAEVIERNTYLIQAAHVRNRTVIDVGANMGMFSILSAALGATQVLACEPVQQTCDRLIHHVNTCSLDQIITCVRAAMTGAPQGPLSIGVHTDSGKNSLYESGEHAELVPTVTLAQLISQATQPEVFLKLDCEGAEYDILLDSDPQVFDKVKGVAIEMHGDLHPVHKGLELIQNRLSELGFNLDQRQPYGIWWYDSQGNRVKWESLNMTIELWSK